jgi:hypothetical protein
MSANRLEHLDRRIDRLRKQLTAAEHLRSVLAANPDLIELLEPEPDEGHQHEQKRDTNGFVKIRVGSDAARRGSGYGAGPVANKYFKKIAEFLEREGNKPAVISEIATQTGVPKNAVIGTLYRTHAGLFESSSITGHATRRAWKLKPDWRELQKATGNRPHQ